ncbi:MAG: PaREP1 family protein [Chloroflexi bacterium]|nr:PaREP1 family protein [Chloroflexota bacterium]MCI0792673.1 PaREP1 family protein [Chloroflexota bacterium]
MVSQGEEHSNISRDFLAKAEEALAENDLLQASEKGWGAAAHMVKCIAESRGWRHDGHRALYSAVNVLAHETGDPDIRVLFSVASALHSNFYENWMPQEMVADDLAQVRKLLERLESLS